MSADVKRSLTIAGHSTSISLEEPFWLHLKAMASAHGLSIAALVAQIDAAREGRNLSSAIRLYVLRELEAQIAQNGENGGHPAFAKQQPGGPE